jgi:uncharacterized protein (DUF302 family)
MNEQKYARRATAAAFLTSAVLSVTVLAAGTERAMAESTVTSRAVQMEHVKITTPKKYADVQAALEASVPPLDPTMIKALSDGDEKRVAELEKPGPLYIFLKRNHGSILKIAGQPRNAMQYDIGNPHTASKMTRHKLPAGLYAPLRVYLYEDDKGGSVFEYDKPSSEFGQFGDEQVDVVARGLDRDLASALKKAAE